MVEKQKIKILQLLYFQIGCPPQGCLVILVHLVEGNVPFSGYHFTYFFGAGYQKVSVFLEPVAKRTFYWSRLLCTDMGTIMELVIFFFLVAASPYKGK